MQHSAPPSPADAKSVDDLAGVLVELRAWAGNPSFAEITRRVTAARRERNSPVGSPGRVTVYDCFRPGRRRIDTELLVDILSALGLGEDEIGRWRLVHSGLTLSARVTAQAVNTLPEPTAGYRGRRELIDNLLQQRPGSTTLISGMAGSGKTELALQVAARWSKSLGPNTTTLYVDLHGDDVGVRPVQVLDSFLRLLGVPAGNVDQFDLDRKVRTYQNLMAARVSVVILDNAADTSQVLPLLPSGGKSRVLVTTRRKLPGLQGLSVELETLTETESRNLLAALVGERRVVDEAVAADQLIALCGYLPLDITVVAATINQRPHWSLHDHAQRLASMPRDEHLRPALSASYAQLAEPTRQMLRLIGLFPGPTITVAAAAALAGLSEPETRELLQHLVSEHLLRTGALGVYRVHDVVRAYAKRLSETEEAHSENRQRIIRLVDHYLAVIAEIPTYTGATNGAPVTKRSDVQRAIDDASTDPNNAGVGVAWLNIERENLLAAAQAAADYVAPQQVSQLAGALAGFLDSSHLYADAEVLHSLAATHGLPELEGQARNDLSRVLLNRGRLHEALHHRHRAIALGEVDNGRAYTGLGNILRESGRYDEAEQAYIKAASVAERLGAQFALGRALANRGELCRLTGRYEEAAEFFARAREVSLDAGDDYNLAIVADNSGMMALDRQQFDLAIEFFETCGSIAGSLGSGDMFALSLVSLADAKHRRGDQVAALQTLELAEQELAGMVRPRTRCHLLILRGKIYAAQDRTEAALSLLTEAEDLAAEVGYPGLQASILNYRGDVHLTNREAGLAIADHAEAERLATTLRRPDEIAYAARGIGDAHLMKGDREAARPHLRRALAIYDQLKDPKAGPLRDRLPGV